MVETRRCSEMMRVEVIIQEASDTTIILPCNYKKRKKLNISAAAAAASIWWAKLAFDKSF